MSILNWQGNSSSNYASFFISMTRNFPANFKLIYFVLCLKGPHQSPNFETFKCPGENLPNSSCHFWKHKSDFLQILHWYLAPSNITTLYLFTSNILYFGQKQPIKVQLFGTFECSSQYSSNSLGQFWNSQFLVKFFTIL